MADVEKICLNCEDAPSMTKCIKCPTAMQELCSECNIQMHKPTKFRNHCPLPIKKENVNALCSRCYGVFLDGNNHSELLRCEECILQRFLKDTLYISMGRYLCMDCDAIVHQSKTHVRTMVHIDTPDGKNVEYILAGQSVQVTDYEIGAFPAYVGAIFSTGINLGIYMEYLASKNSSYWHGKSVLELGCGVAALPSITAALLGARIVIASDFVPEALTHVDKIFERIFPKCQIQQKDDTCWFPNIPHGHTRFSWKQRVCDDPLLLTSSLKWGDPLEADLKVHVPVDIIVGSYLLYDPDNFDSLAQSLQLLANAHTVILLTSDEPTREHLFLAALEKYGFVGEHVKMPEEVEMDPRWCEQGKDGNRRKSNILRCRLDTK